jgi:beta-lactamase class A
MKYVTFTLDDGATVVTQLGGASRLTDGSVHIWAPGDVDPWVMAAGGDADAAWAAVEDTVTPSAAQVDDAVLRSIK